MKRFVVTRPSVVNQRRRRRVQLQPVGLAEIGKGVRIVEEDRRCAGSEGDVPDGDGVGSAVLADHDR